MLSMRGTIKENSVVIDEDIGQRDMSWYEGRDVLITILDRPSRRRPKEDIDLSQYVTPTERGKNADQYIRELRANDRV